MTEWNPSHYWHSTTYWALVYCSVLPYQHSTIIPDGVGLIKLKDARNGNPLTSNDDLSIMMVAARIYAQCWNSTSIYFEPVQPTNDPRINTDNLAIEAIAAELLKDEATVLSLANLIDSFSRSPHEVLHERSQKEGQ